MKIFVDNQIARIFADRAAKLLENAFISNRDNHISFGWPSLLEYLDLGSVLASLPEFDQTQPFFKACVSTLCATEDKEVLFYVYDRLFTENLTQIKSLPQINAAFLLQAMKRQRETPSFLEAERVLSPVLDAYETAFVKKEAYTMHDLILYLSWDRMCVCLANLFNHQSADPKFLKGIDVLKECLIESYQHISQQGKTSPGIYRLLEALFFYQMREENLSKHTDAEWAMLSRSFQVLKSQDVLVDFSYIDDAVISDEMLKIEEENQECYLTLDSAESINSRLALAQYMMHTVKAEIPQWCYTLRPMKIVYLNL